MERTWARITLRRLVRILAFLFVVNTFVLPQLAGTRDAVQLLGRLDPSLLALGVAAELASLACLAHLVRTLVPPDTRPSPWTVQRIVLASRAASRVVPGGAAAGGVLSYRLLRRVGVPTADAGFSVGTQSLQSAAVLIVIVFCAMVVSIPLSGLNASYVLAASFGAVLLLALGGLVVAVASGHERSIYSARRLAEWLRVLDPDRVEALLRTLGARVCDLAASPRELARQVGWSASAWLLDALALGVFLAAYGHWTRPDALLVAFGIANIAAVLPITPGGLGIMEVTLSAALVGFGVPSGIALLGVVSWRLVNFWLPIPAGAASYLSLRVGRAGLTPAAELEALAGEALVEADETLPFRHGRADEPRPRTRATSRLESSQGGRSPAENDRRSA